MAHFDFRKDLEDGHWVQFVIRNHIIRRSGFLHISSSTEPDKLQDEDEVFWDGEKVITYECKGDWWVTPDRVLSNGLILKKDSGNIFIEYECSGKLSGISNTKAHYYSYYFTYLDELWTIPVSELKTLISQNNFPILTSPKIKSKGYGIPRNEYIEHFKVEHNILEELKKYLL
jgi:hypothetical protein